MPPSVPLNRSHTCLIPRNPLLVVVWSFGLFVLMHTTQYVFIWAAARSTGATFGEVASGNVVTAWTLFLRGTVALLLGIPATLLVTRFLWRRSAAWMRTQMSVRLLLMGGLLGLAAVALVVVVMLAGGLVHLSIPVREGGMPDLLRAQVGLLGWALFTAIAEEYVFRGMATREMAYRWGWPQATIAGGVFFSASHLIAMVPVLTPWLFLGILAAGMVVHILFVTLYVRSLSLWLPIGFHAGWNYALSGLMGATMSGQTSSHGLLDVAVNGPSFLTGGDFGIEASAISVVVTAAMVPCVVFWFRRGRPGLPSTDPVPLQT